MGKSISRQDFIRLSWSKLRSSHGPERGWSAQTVSPQGTTSCAWMRPSRLVTVQMKFGGQNLRTMALRTVEICCDYGDLRTRAKVERLVSAFAQTIEPDGKIFGDPQITGGAAYLYDKLVCGLMDAHQFGRSA